MQEEEEGNLWVDQEEMGVMRKTRVKKRSLHQQMEVLRHPENQGRRRNLRNPRQLRQGQTARQILRMKGSLNLS